MGDDRGDTFAPEHPLTPCFDDIRIVFDAMGWEAQQEVGKALKSIAVLFHKLDASDREDLQTLLSHYWHWDTDQRHEFADVTREWGSLDAIGRDRVYRTALVQACEFSAARKAGSDHE